MDSAHPEWNPHSVETEVAALWKARRLPPAGGVLGPPSGPTVRQFEGSWTQGDFPALVAHRAVVADVDARYLVLVGRRVSGTLRQGPTMGSAPPTTIPALLGALGVWTGGDGRVPWDAQDRSTQVQAMVGRLAWKEVLVTRDESFRICPTCGTLRSPERIVYDEQEGDTYLVRFPIRVGEWTVHALVWVDAPWKLLGASALLLNPNLRYVVAGYRHREDRELVLTSASSMERLRSWIPESQLEVVQERPGREFQGLPYTYPLRHEFPMGGDLSSPAGTLQSAVDVGDSGTGIVPLVPGHGPTDARIADRLGVTGWPLLTAKGRLDYTLMHKYAGLDLDTANEFVVRDLSEAGALLARLRVKRGVPYCSVCGTPLLWAPARAWCLEPARLPAERRAMFSRLLPREPLPGQSEVAPWPVSEAGPSEDPAAVTLLECARCDRLEAPEGTKQCPCGGQRSLVRRKLLPSIEAALLAWARFDPFLEGDSAHLYVGHRRRVPSLVHHLAAMSGVEGNVSDVSLTVVPTVAAVDLPDLVATHGADVVRAAIVRSGLSESAGGRFSDQCRREADRVRRWWMLSREVLSYCDPPMIAEFARPVGGFVGELEAEDRAIIARWERTRVLALAHYDHGAPGMVHRRVARFIDNDLADYCELIRARLALAGTPPTKRAALRTLFHLLRGTSEVLAPIVPFTAEAIHRSLAPERTSLFEQPMAGLDRTILNDDLIAAWDRWRSVLRSIDRLRRSRGIARTTVLPGVVLVTAADDLGDRLRAERELLARLGRVRRVEVGSPREPWRGRQRVLRPVESEIQRVYPTQAAQLAHILQRMAPRRGASPTGEEELSVVLDGYPVRVFPSMVSYVDTLPNRVVPAPWSLGEMYIELPGTSETSAETMPPLSSDAYWLVRRVDHRLRMTPLQPGEPTRVAVVTVKDPLASELRTSAPSIARYLGLGEFRVVEKAEEAVPPNAMTGRTRTGDHWWVHVPGLPAPRSRSKRARSTARLSRVAIAAPSSAAPEVDFADEQVVARAEAVRALGRELDDLVGIPLLGPAKVAGAWDRGLHSVDDLRHAPFEVVSTLPGFGGPVAQVVVEKLGGTVPARSARSTPRRRLPLAPPAHPPRIVLPDVSPSPPGTEPSVSGPPAPAMDAVAGSGASPPETEPTLELPPPEETPHVGPALSELPLVAPVEETVPEPLSLSPSPPPEALPAEAAPIAEAPAGTPDEPVDSEVPSPPETVPSPLPEPILPVVPVETADVEPKVEEGPPREATAAPEAPVPEPEAEPAPPPVSTAPSESAETSSSAPEESSSALAPVAVETVPAAPEDVEPEIVEAEPLPAPEMAPEAVVPDSEIPAEPEPLPPESDMPAVLPGVAPPPPEVPPPEELLAPTESPEGAPTLSPEPPTLEATAIAPEPGVAPAPGDAAPRVEPGSTESPAPEPEPVPAPEPVATVVEVPEVPEPVPAAPPASPETPLAPSPSIPLPREPEPSPPRAHPSPVVAAEPPALETAAVTVVPPVPPPEPLPPSPPTGVEVAPGESLTAAMGGFLDATAAGHRGVCVVRESPERIRARVGSRPIDVYWLSNIGRGPSLRPADLDGLWSLLSRKLVDDHDTAFFFEGIEYLVRLHGVDAVLTGLVEFDHLAREHDARVWVYLTPGLMKPADIDRFRSTFGGAASTA